MSELLVQQFLNEFSAQELTDTYGIAIREYPEAGIMTLNYSQIDSPKHSELVRECRALILENNAPYKVVARTFDRFFNHGECPDTDKFDITRYVAWEKLDGSIMPVYHHNNEWHCATRKMAFAEGENARGYTFREMFSRSMDLNAMHGINKDLTFIFEMVSPDNRIVKPYKENDIFLIGVRNRVTGVEFDDSQLVVMADILGVKLPKMYKFNTISAVFESLGEFEAFEEGYVFCNYDTMHRIKVKNPSYVAIAHLRDNGNLSPKRVITLVFKQDHEEYLLLFPEDRDFFQPFIDGYCKMIDDINSLREQYMSIEDQKEFALKVKDTPVANVMFQLRKGMTLDQIFSKFTDNSKLKMMGFYTGRKLI